MSQKPTSFKRRLVNVSGSLKLTIPRAICESFRYKPNEPVVVYAPDENSIIIERAEKKE